jgi:hypothetical protein
MTDKIIRAEINPDIKGMLPDGTRRQWHTSMLRAFHVSNTLGDLSKPSDDGFGAGDTRAS